MITREEWMVMTAAQQLLLDVQDLLGPQSEEMTPLEIRIENVTSRMRAVLARIKVP